MAYLAGTLENASDLQAYMSLAYETYQTRMGGKRIPMDLDYADETGNYPTWVAEIDQTLVGGITSDID